MKKFFIICSVVLAVYCTPASGQITINLGSHQLLADTAGQSIDILLERAGTEQIIGANGAFQITGSGILPSFNLVSNSSNNGTIVSGAVFDGPGFVFDNAGVLLVDEVPPGIFPEAQSALFSVLGETEVDAEGIFVQLEVDTTGVFGGEFDLIELVSETVYFDGDTNVLDRTPSVNGLITITAVPEPTNLVVLAGLTGLVSSRRRQRLA